MSTIPIGDSADGACVQVAEPHFLDTNAYATLLRGAPSDVNARLRARLSRGMHVEAAISELTALEIHSVVGRLARGCTGGFHLCERSVESISGLIQCSHRWAQQARKPLRPRELDRLRKAIRDAENGHGPVRITVIPLESVDLVGGRSHLYTHSPKWRFGSHDAVIVAAAVRHEAGASRFVTSDGPLKSLLKAISQRFYDPEKDELWDPPNRAPVAELR